MSHFSALYLIRGNIRALLTAQGQNQTELAFWMGKDKSWINKFLNGSREIQLKDLDRIADFFGIHTYQLFQPGIARSAERRKGYDRRTGTERRIGHTQRALRAEVNKAGGHAYEAATTDRKTAALHSLVVDFTARADRLLSAEDPGGQDSPTGRTVPKTRTRA